jgi:hypothetical protein
VDERGGRELVTDGVEPANGSIAARVHWSDLGLRAKAWRVVHAGWSIAQLACLWQIWVGVLTGRRHRRLWLATAFVGVEGAALVIGQGNCPVGPRQAEWGDPVPFFELVLPPRAAKAAIPILAVVASLGIAGLALRRPGLRLRHPSPAGASTG